MKRIGYIVCAVLLLTACERKITYDGEITEPKLVLQAEVGEGDTLVKCFVSRSRFFLERYSYKPDDYLMPDAVTEFQRGESEWQKMSYSATDKAFVLPLDSALQVGETVRVRASHPDYETISAEQTIVQQPFMQLPDKFRQYYLYHYPDKHLIGFTIILQNYVPTDVTLGLNVRCQYNVTYKTGKNTRTTGGTTTQVFSMEELFATGENAYSNNYGFTSRYELYFSPGYENATVLELQTQYSTPGLQDEIVTKITINELEISFNAHSRDSYLYRKSMSGGRRYGQTDEFDLSTEVGDIFGFQEEDVQVYSNITNGYGIFAACSRYKLIQKNITVIP